MAALRRSPRLSVQTKVLIPVLGFLVLLPVIMAWLVDDRIAYQAQVGAHRDLATADSVFRQGMDGQLTSLQTRVRDALNDPKYKAIAKVAEESSPSANETIRRFLKDRLDDYGDDYDGMAFSPTRGGQPVVAARSPLAQSLDEFERAVGEVAGAALNTGPTRDTLILQGAAYKVVSLPWTDGQTDEPVGALTLAVRIQVSAVQELAQITQTNIILVGDHQVIASTLTGAEPVALAQIAADAQAGNPGKGQFIRPEPVLLNGEHYLSLTNTYDQAGSRRGFRYVLLFAFEPSLRAVADTRQTLIAISTAGILLSGLIVWFFVRRFTQPIRELRDSAEAVGRGDFSRRIGRFANDECGDLAAAFNRMTTNLESSRAELQQTVDTLKNTQAQLVQSEKLSAVGQFVAGVAHELNNPLTAVIGFSELLSQTGTDEKVRPHLELINKSAHRCHKIVQNLLGFARQHAPERKLVQLNGTVDEVLELMAYDLRTSNIDVRREFQTDLPAILADPHQLQQVFVNIVGNARQAIQAFRPDGSIRVRTRTENGWNRIEFADNGPGIRPENLSRIFDPFFTTKAVGKGTGLGLSLSYGIIQEHGGRIRVESQLGQGATFIIELPIGEAGPSRRGEPERRATIGPRAAAASGKAVLVIDDEDWILSLAHEILRHAGHSVQTASGGEEALAALRRTNFDVVICDWKMPGMNGIQFYEQVRVSEPAVADRVLFMSGDVINETFQSFLLRHKKVCLSKPFPIEEFQDAVTRRLASAGAAASVA
jgi:signal transduction histidine kinase/ActR/RegA family two-component response regulator